MAQRGKAAGPIRPCLFHYPVKFCGHRSPPLSAADVSLNRSSTAPPLPHVHGFPVRVLPVGPTSSKAFASLRVSFIRFAYSNPRPCWISRVPDISFSRHTVPIDPAWDSSDLAIVRSLTVAFRHRDAVGPRIIALRGSLSFTFVTVYLSLCLRLATEARPANHAARAASVTGSSPRLDSWWVASPFQGGNFTH